jgi:hypothetical protein
LLDDEGGVDNDNDSPEEEEGFVSYSFSSFLFFDLCVGPV